MKPAAIESVLIRGFRSLADVKLSGIPKAAVLIGANGSGKSNFIRFFEMLNWMLGSRRLAEFVKMQGGADDQLHGGSRRTSRIEAEVRLRTESGCTDYGFILFHAHPDRLSFTEERLRSSSDTSQKGTLFPMPEMTWHHFGNEYQETGITQLMQPGKPHDLNADAAKLIVKLFRNCIAYQFHDTSDTSNFKKRWDAEDNNQLHGHGGNLAAVLLRLEQEDTKRYEAICRHISRVLPVFDRFHTEQSFGKVLLRWKAKGAGKTFGAHLTSDGSLRFFSLVTLLNLPPEMLPDVILLDEPELGLHPAAIALIGGMIKALSEERQVIVATQSPLLVDAFDLDEIFVSELHGGCTEFRKLAPDDYQVWLDDNNFTPGELWQKNLLGGRP